MTKIKAKMMNKPKLLSKMNLRFLLVLLFGITITFSIFSFTAYSETQSLTPSIQLLSDSKVFIFVQTIVENSDGSLVTYLTSDKFTDLDSDALDILIETEKSEGDPIVIINDQEFQVIQRFLRISHDEESVVASTILVNEQNDIIKPVARFAHDGYPLLEGEIVTSGWTFIIPVE